MRRFKIDSWRLWEGDGRGRGSELNAVANGESSHLLTEDRNAPVEAGHPFAQLQDAEVSEKTIVPC